MTSSSVQPSATRSSITTWSCRARSDGDDAIDSLAHTGHFRIAGRWATRSAWDGGEPASTMTTTPSERAMTAPATPLRTRSDTDGLQGGLAPQAAAAEKRQGTTGDDDEPAEPQQPHQGEAEDVDGDPGGALLDPHQRQVDVLAQSGVHCGGGDGLDLIRGLGESGLQGAEAGVTAGEDDGGPDQGAVVLFGEERTGVGEGVAMESGRLADLQGHGVAAVERSGEGDGDGDQGYADVGDHAAPVPGIGAVEATDGP